MTVCVKTQFSRKILCAGTMRDAVEIYENVLGPPDVGSTTPTTSKTVVAQYMGHLEEVNPVIRFDGVSVDTRAPGDKHTHVIYMPYDDTVYRLDTNKLWAQVNDRDELYKLTKIKRYHDEYLQLYVQETGFDTNQGAQS